MEISKKNVKFITERLFELEAKNMQLHNLGVNVTLITADWYDLVLKMLKHHLNDAQLDLLICYVYEPEKFLEYTESLDIDALYENLIKLESIQEHETTN